MKIILYVILWFLTFFIIQQISFNFIVSNFWKIVWSNSLITRNNYNIIMENNNWKKEIIKNVVNDWNDWNDWNDIKISDEQFDYMEIWNKKIIVQKAKNDLIWATFIVYKTIKDKNWNKHYYFYWHSWPTQYYIWKWLRI